MTKIEEWKLKLENQGKSGLTQVAWCNANNIGLSKFRYWKRKIDRSEPEEVRFLELRNENSGRESAAIFLEVSGVRINVFPSAKTDLLVSVIKAAKSC
jgi:hypothetical protein